MARALSPEKRRLILQSALRAIAVKGLAASTSTIAREAGLAEGTMFTYFPSKDALFNDLYVELKSVSFGRIQNAFPTKASLRERAQHVWMEYLRWATEKPEDRKVAMLLHLSPVVSAANRARMSAELGLVAETMAELDTHSDGPHGRCFSCLARLGSDQRGWHGCLRSPTAIPTRDNGVGPRIPPAKWWVFSDESMGS